MKKKDYYLSLILCLMLGCVTFTACSSDDDDNKPGQQTDFGSDGLKGYWVQNNWKEVVVEEFNYHTPTGVYGTYRYERTESTNGHVTMMIYLDGEGGGTMHTNVTTLDRVNNNSKVVSTDLGSFYDTADGSTKQYYSFDKYFWYDKYIGDSSQDKSYSFDFHMDKSSALTYYLQGTTMSIFYNNTTEKIELNASTGGKSSAGSVSNYHRLTKK